MNKSIKGFSLVEIITTTAIIAVLAIIGFTFATNYQSNQYNTSRVSDLTAIYNLFQTNFTQSKSYPDPNGNKQYYTSNGTYSHGAGGAFGVSGFLTPKTFTKDKMGYAFRDEQTKNYYGYGKRLDGNSGYNLATVLNQKGEYFGYVIGDIGGNRMELAGLVKEYAGPNFVTNKSKYLPYNPYEIKLTGRVSVYLGAVTITNGNGDLITSTNILDHEIEKGNVINVPAGGIAIINLSDGTELRLGSETESSILDFSELEYTDNSNLFTKVMLNLSLGEIWVKAPELEKESVFMVRNKFMAATVRGTVFGMTTNTSSGTVSLIDGKLEVEKVNETGASTPLFTDNIGTGFKVVDGASYMEVAPGELPISYIYSETTTPTIGNVSSEKVLEIETPKLKFNSGMLPNIISIDRNVSGKLGMKVENMGATSIEIKGTGKEQEDYYSGTFLATYSYFSKTDIPWPNLSNNYAVRLCVDIIEGQKNCTGRAIQNTSGGSMSEASIINFKRNSAGFKLICETGTKSFPGFGCMDEKLVAYMPYDNSGDLYMYTASPTVGNGRLEPATDRVAKFTYDGGNYYKNDGTYSNSNGVDYNHVLISSNTVNIWDISNSFMSMNSGDRGILVSQNPNYPYMKYNLSKLNLGDSFSIEMSVRGGALKRPSTTAHLFALGNNEDHANQLSFGIYGNNLIAIKGTSNILTVISQSSISISDLNKFYKLKFNFIESGTKIQIFLDDNLINTINIFSWNYPYNLINNIKIGSSLNMVNAWNDIIDYVKIYK